MRLSLLVLLCPFLIGVANAKAQAKYSVDFATISLALKNTNPIIISEQISGQIEDSLYAADEAEKFLSQNQKEIDLKNFKVLYKIVMDRRLIKRFGEVVNEHNVTNILNNAVIAYMEPNHECKLFVSDVLSTTLPVTKKVDILCLSSVYGESHWVDKRSMVTDTYYISMINGKIQVKGFDFGLLTFYTQNILKNIKSIEKYAVKKTFMY